MSWPLQKHVKRKLMDCAGLELVEKEFILNWNSYTRSHPLHGDLHVPRVLEAFATEHCEVRLRVLPEAQAAVLPLLPHA